MAPALLRITEEIWNRKAGHKFSLKPWDEFELDTKEYDELRRIFQEDSFMKRKLRYGARA